MLKPLTRLQHLLYKEENNTMHIQTKNFGPLDIDDQKIIHFAEGIPGFPDLKTYILITDEEQLDSPFCWLQSVGDGGVAFALVNPFSFYPEYSPEIDEGLLETLGDFQMEDLVVYNIVVVPEDITRMTANLRAPIIINSNTQKAIQTIARNEEYQIKHSIYQEIKSRTSKEEGE